MVGKARSFSDEAKEANYEKQFGNEVYSAGAQQNSYNLGSVHFSDQSGIANISQAGTDQRKASLQGALYRGNVGFDLQTALLDVGTKTIDLNNDATGTVLDVISTDRFVVLSAGTVSELEIITGAQRPGQRLRLYNTISNTISIKHTAAATPNTIRTPDGNDVEFAGNAALDFTFDITTSQWRVVGGPGGNGGGGSDGTGTFISSNLSVDQIANLAVGEHVEFDNDSPPKGASGGIVLQTGAGQANGIYELKQGLTYFLSAAVNPQFNAVNHIEFVWYDITNATELGVRTKIDDATLAMNQPKNEIIFTPGVDVTVEVRIVAVTTPANLTGFDSVYSFAHIFELNATLGAGTGTYASAKMDQDQVSNLALNDHFQFNDYVENGGIVLQGQTPTFDQTSGIFELKTGKTYYLYGDATAEFNGVNDTAKIAWWDRTNGVQLGQKGSSFPFSNSTRVSTKHSAQTIFTPASDVEVDLRIVNLTGTITTVFADDSQANIFEFSSGSGTPGGVGATTWKLPARAKTTQDVPDLNNFNVITDGVTLVEDDRVLLTEQITQAENGLWQVGVVAGGLAPLTRPIDFDTDEKVLAETFVAVEEGTLHENTLWHLISDNPLTIDVSVQVWEQLGGAQAIGPDMGQDNQGNDATGNFVFDGRIYAAYDKLKRVQQYWNLDFPTGEVGDLILLDAVPYQHGDFGGGSTPADNPQAKLVVVGEQGGIGGAGFATSSYSLNFGETWVANNDLGINNVWRRLTYDPVGRVLICLDNGFGGINDNIGRSLDKGETWANASGTRPTHLNDVIWVPSLSLFVGPERVTSTDFMWTSPDGNTWTQQTTPTITGGWAYTVAFNPDNGLIYCWTHANEVVTSPDGINWTLHSTTGFWTSNAPGKTIWSRGQQKWVSKPRQFFANDGTYHSEDGITWTHYDTITDMNQVVDNIIYSDELSLWIIAGVPNTGKMQPFAISNDAITWENMPPSGVMRNQDYDPPELSSSGLMTPRGIAFSSNFNYFFAAGGNTQSTSNDNFRTRFWRTDVYFNEIANATVTFRDALNPR